MVAILLATAMVQCKTTASSELPAVKISPKEGAKTVLEKKNSENKAETKIAPKILDFQDPNVFVPIFRRSTSTPISDVSPFIARDPEIDASAGKVKPEELQLIIKQKELDLRKLTSQSPDYLPLKTSILRLHKTQAVALENLLNVVHGRSQFTNPALLAKSENGIIDFIAAQLMREFPSHPLVREWKIDSLQARIRQGDRLAVTETVRLFPKPQNSGETRTRLLAIVMPSLQSKVVNFDAERLAGISQQAGISRAALYLLAANVKTGKGDFAGAFTLFLSCMRFASGNDSSQRGLFFKTCVDGAVESALKFSPHVPDPKLPSILAHLREHEAAQSYLEQVALRNGNPEPQEALKIYEQLLAMAPAGSEERARILVRNLDLALRTSRLPLAQQHWQALANFLKDTNYKLNGLDKRISATYSLIVASTASIAADRNTLEAAQKTAGLLETNVLQGNQRDDRVLEMAKILMRATRPDEALERASFLLANSKSTEHKNQSLRIAFDAKKKQMRLSSDPYFDSDSVFVQDRISAQNLGDFAYKLAQVTAEGSDREVVTNFAARAEFLLDNQPKFLAAFGEALKNSPGPLTQRGASYYIKASEVSRPKLAEQILRMIIDDGLIPSSPEHKKPKELLASLMWKNAEKLDGDKRYAEAATAYADFREANPNHANAPLALQKAASAARNGALPDREFTYLELLAESYPKTEIGAAALLQSAELFEKRGNFGQAAEKYSAYAKRYRPQAIEKNIFEKVAQLYLKESNVDSAIDSFKVALSTQTVPEKRVAILKILADLYDGKKEWQQALDAHSQIRQIVSASPNRGLSDESLWADKRSMEVAIAQGQRLDAEARARKLAVAKAQSQLGLTSVARARVQLGLWLSESIQKTINEPNFVIEYENIIVAYNKSSQLMLSPCEIAGSRWCSVGYYESAYLAKILHSAFRTAIPVGSDNQANPIRVAVTNSMHNFENDFFNYRLRAQDAFERFGTVSKEYEKKIEQLVLEEALVPASGVRPASSSKDVETTSAPAPQEGSGIKEEPLPLDAPPIVSPVPAGDELTLED